MSKKFKKHVFVCENVRDSSSKKSCGKIGAQIRVSLKKEIRHRKLSNRIRINKSGCLGKCDQGACVVVYPQSKWYFNTKLEECYKITNQLVSD